MIKKYEKRPPLQVEAVQFTRMNVDEVIKFTKGNAKNFQTERKPDGRCWCEITTSKGVVEADEKDYIVKAGKEFYPCKPNIFEKEYQEL
jgi:hypothetical protein